jgi:protein gp37
MSKIEWTDETWNPVTGCSPVSPGCVNCYAERMSTRLAGRCGYPADRPFAVTLHPEKLEEPLRWKKPRMVFPCSMSDLFHKSISDDYRTQIFAVMALSPRHTYQVLTKRAEEMLAFMTWLAEEPADTLSDAAGDLFGEEAHCWVANWLNGWSRPEGIVDDNPCNGTVPRWPLPNVWVGATICNQEEADRNVPLLLQTPAAVRFVSVEPMLGDIDLDGKLPIWRCQACGEAPAISEGWRWNGNNWQHHHGYPVGHIDADYFPGIDWVICGGETGAGARPVHPGWVRGLRDQCVSAGVPFFFKSWGDWAPEDQYTGPVETIAVPLKNFRLVEGFAFHRVGKKAAGRKLDGRVWDQLPLRG